MAEFYNSVTSWNYISGGKAAAGFIHGPLSLYTGQGRSDGSKTEKDIITNFGGPSESTCARNSAVNTVDSSVIKPQSVHCQRACPKKTLSQ